MVPEQIIYSGTLALLAFIPVAISSMVSFYRKEREQKVEKSELAWFRRLILTMVLGLWLIIVANLSVLEVMIQWTEITTWRFSPLSISIALLTVSLGVITTVYTIYIILFFNRIDWDSDFIEKLNWNK